MLWSPEHSDVCWMCGRPPSALTERRTAEEEANEILRKLRRINTRKNLR